MQNTWSQKYHAPSLGLFGRKVFTSFSHASCSNRLVVAAVVVVVAVVVILDRILNTLHQKVHPASSPDKIFMLICLALLHPACLLCIVT